MFSAFTRDEVVTGGVRWTVGLAAALLVHRLVRRVPWPRPFRLRFLAMHVVAAPVAALAWHAVSAALLSVVSGGSFVQLVGERVDESLFIGIFLYIVVAGVSYAVENSARVARAESVTARTQLAALRAQLHPHFLFNALHTVVQLIPIDPQRASEAAELLADLLRATLDEQRDEVPLGDEWRFVSRYLEIERIRFGDRLVVRADVPDSLLDARVPAFALQTLVENAVHHGAAPRIAPTEIVVTAAGSASELTLSVKNTGDRDAVRTIPGTGTGLARLHERLAVLYGSAAKLICGPREDGGYEAVLVAPRARATAS